MLLCDEEEAGMVGEGEVDARLQHPTGRPDEDGDGSWLLGYGYSSERTATTPELEKMNGNGSVYRCDRAPPSSAVDDDSGGEPPVRPSSSRQLRR